MRDIQDGLANTPKKESPTNDREMEQRAREREQAYERRKEIRKTRIDNLERQREAHKNGNKLGRHPPSRSSWIEAGFFNGSLRVVDSDDEEEPCSSTLCCW
jgi:hypothetical protein